MTSCSFNATIPGLGDFVVLSAALGGAVPELSNVVDGNVYGYYAQSFDSLGVQTGWESGSGIYTVSTHSLKRTTITANSNGDTNPVNFPLAPIVNVYANGAKTLEPALGACAVWATWQSASIFGSFNVASITRTSTGVYTVNFIKPFADTNYSILPSATGTFFGNTTTGTRQLTSVGLTFLNSSFAVADPPVCDVAMFGRQ